jgi:hypothetical protein
MRDKKHLAHPIYSSIVSNFYITLDRPHGEMVKIFLGIFFKNFCFEKIFSFVILLSKKIFFRDSKSKIIIQAARSPNFEKMIGS